MKRNKKFVATIIAVAVLFSSVPVFATGDDMNESNSFIYNGQQYTIIESENMQIRDCKLLNEKGSIIGHMTYDLNTGVLKDVKTGKKYEPEIVFNKEISTLALKKGQKDSEGYSYIGTYRYDYGECTTAISLILTLTTAGIPISTAKNIAGNAIFNGLGIFYSQNEQWRKEDKTYIYVKTHVTVYEKISGKNHKLGKHTRRQKKAKNGTASVEVPVITHTIIN